MPVCGSEAGFNPAGAKIECQSEWCNTVQCGVQGKKEAIKAWNTRAQPTDEELELKHFPNVKPSDNYKSLRRQFSALLTMLASNEEICSVYMKQDYKLSEKRLKSLEDSLESERDMNAQLTSELDALTLSQNHIVEPNKMVTDKECAEALEWINDNKEVAEILLERNLKEFPKSSSNMRYANNIKYYNTISQALSRPQVDGWQPIETAPKDGGRFLGLTSYGVEIVKFTKGKRSKYYNMEKGFIGVEQDSTCIPARNTKQAQNQPAKWMPLPKALDAVKKFMEVEL